MNVLKAVLLISLLILAYLFPQRDSHQASLKPVVVRETAQQHKLDYSETTDRTERGIETAQKAKVKNL